MVHKSPRPKWGADHAPESHNLGHTLTVTSLPAGFNLCVWLDRFL